jgi:hypothetical protein
MIASWLVLVLVLTFAVGVGCLLSARSRIIGIVLLALLAFGFFSVRVQVHRSVAPAPQIVAIDEHGGPIHFDEHHAIDGNLYDAQEPARRAEEAAKAASVRAQAEIVRNQRLASRMEGAIAQQSPDFSWLETYPDGMQVKQEWPGRRSIVREADGRARLEEPPTISPDATLWILGAPLLALAVAFVALRSRPRVGGYGKVLVGAVGLACIFGGYLSIQPGNVYIPEPIETKLEIPSGSALMVHRSVDVDKPSAGRREVVEHRPAPVPPAESIEAAWSRLTGPKIKLEADESTSDHVSPKELVAAKTVLTTTAPGVDPITQSWLASIAKATLHALAEAHKSSEAHSAQATIEPMAEAIAEYEAAAAGQAGKTLATSVPDEPRPEWLDDTPNRLLGNSRRMVVSGDPFMLDAEAHDALRQTLRDVVRIRLIDVAESANGGNQVYVPEVERLGLSDEFIESELCLDKYVETVSTSVGEMKRAHALVEFAEAKDQFMFEHWRLYAQQESIEDVGQLAMLAVGCLGMVYGLLKVDTWTRGYYTKRLFIGAGAAIIALVMLMLA